MSRLSGGGNKQEKKKTVIEISEKDFCIVQ